MVRLFYAFIFSLLLSQSLSAQTNVLERSAVEELLKLERYHVFNLGERVNTQYSEYNPVLSPDGQYILYTSRNDTTTGENIYAEDRQYFEDISLAREADGQYQGLAGKDNPLGSYATTVNTRNHEAPVYISNDAQTIIMFKDNDLWYSERVNGVYTEPVRYPKNINFKYYHRHASLTADGNTMYFTAEVLDKVSGRFHLDLFKTVKDDKGDWQKPVALPASINTLYNEDSPEVSADGSMLFYSSDRADGLGGYDIYYVNLTHDTLAPLTLRSPINSSAEDIYFKLLPDGKSAYFSSSRLGGYGAMDLYKVSFYKQEAEDCTKGLAENTMVKITGSDTLKVGSFALLSASGTVVSGKRPDFYDWYINDSLVAKGADFKWRMDSIGSYNVKLFAAIVDSNYLGFTSACDQITIEVQRAEDFNSSTVVDLGIPAEEQSFSEQQLLDVLPEPLGILVLANDVGSTYQGVPLQLAVTDNDPAAKQKQLVIAGLSQPKYGTVMVNDSRKGTIQYYPGKDFVGNDGFSYTVNTTSGEFATAYVGVRVLLNPFLTDTNQTEPQANTNGTAIDYAITTAGRLVAINVLLNDAFDVRSKPKLTAITSPQHGAARIYDGNEGIVVYAPNASFVGTDKLTYEVVAEGKPYKGEIVVNVGEREAPLLITKTETSPDTSATSDTAGTLAVNDLAANAAAQQSKVAKMAGEVVLSEVNSKQIDENLRPKLALKTIYFDFDRSYIRSDARATMAENIAILKANPEVVIKVVSHCDARGASSYNQLLSAARAKATVDYLVSQGITKERIGSAVGFGEEQLVNECGDDVPCLKAKHQENRRSEFYVIGSLKK